MCWVKADADYGLTISSQITKVSQWARKEGRGAPSRVFNQYATRLANNHEKAHRKAIDMIAEVASGVLDDAMRPYIQPNYLIYGNSVAECIGELKTRVQNAMNGVKTSTGKVLAETQGNPWGVARFARGRQMDANLDYWDMFTSGNRLRATTNGKPLFTAANKVTNYARYYADLATYLGTHGRFR